MLPFKGLLHDAMSYMHAQIAINGRRGQCADFELNHVECLEAYGFSRGSYLCQKYYEDFQECTSANLRETRARVMLLERNKKVVKGEIPLSKRHVDPIPYDSFMTGTFWP